MGSLKCESTTGLWSLSETPKRENVGWERIAFSFLSFFFFSYSPFQILRFRDDEGGEDEINSKHFCSSRCSISYCSNLLQSDNSTKSVDFRILT